MLDLTFIFDGAIHVIDLSRGNWRDERAYDATSERYDQYLDRHGVSMPGSPMKRFSIEETYRTVFEDSPTDMAMVQVVPLFEYFEDWQAPVELQHSLAAAHPERVLFCGGVDPGFRGLSHALEQIEYQVKELGARSIKFYNGSEWRCDDERIAYPMYERCQRLGLNVLQFHKQAPFAFQNVESYKPNDLQAPARDFPDTTFLIHHVTRAYFQELVNIAGRFPNIHVLMGLHDSVVAPRLIQEQLGQLLRDVGVEKIVHASEGPITGPSGPTLYAFMELEIPEDLRSGYGYPQITGEDKERILGLNFADLFDVDVEAKKLALTSDALS